MIQRSHLVCENIRICRVWKKMKQFCWEWKRKHTHIVSVHRLSITRMAQKPFRKQICHLMWYCTVGHKFTVQNAKCKRRTIVCSYQNENESDIYACFGIEKCSSFHAVDGKNIHKTKIKVRHVQYLWGSEQNVRKLQYQIFRMCLSLMQQKFPFKYSNLNKWMNAKKSKSK